jgi:putative transcriptional regulator
MNSLQGHFLAASPHLQDPNFVHTVVLLIQHDTDGALGVVLNRPTDKTIQQLWEDVHEPSCDNQQHLHLGGPVSGPLMALHTVPALGEFEVLPGLYFSTQKDHLEELVQSDDSRSRLFVGHSGWGGGQLENELQQGAWLTTPATLEDVFFDESQLWRRVTRQITGRMMQEALKIKHVPDDPTVN